jgi:hypothetical protein
VLGTGKTTRVNADCSQDRRGGSGLDPRHPFDQRHRFLQGPQPLFELLLDLCQGFLQEINVRQDLLEQEPMVRLDASVQRLPQLR